MSNTSHLELLFLYSHQTFLMLKAHFSHYLIFFYCICLIQFFDFYLFSMSIFEKFQNREFGECAKSGKKCSNFKIMIDVEKNFSFREK